MSMTLIAGFAVFGFVNGQAGVSALAYGNSVGATDNFLAENFKVVDLYFASTTQTGFWLYNTGSTNLLLFSVRLYDSAGLVNLLYNYTVSGSTKTNYLYDLRSTLSTKCKTAASSYESPTLTTVNTVKQNAVLVALTIPPTQTNCPSFAQTFNTGTTYVITATGLYGNAVTYYQVK